MNRTTKVDATKTIHIFATDPKIAASISKDTINDNRYDFDFRGVTV